MVRGVEDVAPRYKHYNLNLITIAKNSLKVFEGVKGGTFYKKFPLGIYLFY